MAGPSTVARGYSGSIVLDLRYGSADGEVGFEAGGADRLPRGPSSFSVTSGSIYVLDTVGRRLQRFDRASRGVTDVQDIRGGLDLSTTGDGRVFLFDPAVNTIEVFDSQLAPVETIPVGKSVSVPLTTTQDGIPTELSRTRQDVTSTTGEVPCLATRIDDASAQVTTIGTVPRRLQLKTSAYLGSLTCLGLDAQNRIYVVVEYLNTEGGEIDVTKQVEVFAASGRVGVIPLPVDYAAHPVREVVLRPDGSVYHFRPLRDRALVQRWRPVAGSGAGD
jgi:hypothetical protein